MEAIKVYQQPLRPSAQRRFDYAELRVLAKHLSLLQGYTLAANWAGLRSLGHGVLTTYQSDMNAVSEPERRRRAALMIEEGFK